MISVENISKRCLFYVILTHKSIALFFRQIAEFFDEMAEESPRDLATVDRAMSIPCPE